MASTEQQEDPISASSMAASRLKPLGSTTAKRSKKATLLEEESHFLKGINVDTCQDILSVPSPPSPSLSISARQRRRRSSSAFMLAKNRSSPLNDLSNSHTHSPQRKVNGDKQNSSKSKKRRSLCHVPLHRVTTSTSTSSASSKFPPLPPKQASHRPQIDLGENHDNVGQSSGQRKKQKKSNKRRRQSILLPSEVGMAEFQKSTPNGSKEAERNCGNETDTQATTLALATSKFSELQRKIRAYCSLPNESKSRLENAKGILEETGYPLLSHPLSEDGRASRKDLLLKVGPCLEETEERKHQRSRNAEVSTSCFVQKVNGKFQYTDKDGKKVSADEYKVLYLRIIRNEKKAKHQEFSKLREKLASTSQIAPLDKTMQSKHQATKTARKEPPVLETVEKDRRQLAHGGDDIEEGNLSTASPKIIEETKVEQVTQAMGQRNNLKETNESDDKRLSNTECHEATASVVAISDSAPRDTMNLAMMPTEESADPEIAQAERRLWDAIDEALQTYSEQVLDIKARRRAAKTVTTELA
ncbi:expressed unknown protein [Seminavis robusta]|uniref:Uncharacterized protein n=1 Tax=Seminavis robusta TaxID=568900 RepID=A0A9N8E7X7_9STRA|nr:expressed unknown protein [Seminavis robusta]|eukprot:Sro750_g197000.1 n/a (530) ;mRNA; r:32063-33652